MAITFLMDGKEVTAQDGQTLLDVARDNGINIPTICFHEATTANAL
ncbi:MAG: 2Fe-2S iron-sulfur cluster binding domain, partial [Chloroflexota bacterium]